MVEPRRRLLQIPSTRVDATANASPPHESSGGEPPASSRLGRGGFSHATVQSGAAEDNTEATREQYVTWFPPMKKLEERIPIGDFMGTVIDKTGLTITGTLEDAVAKSLYDFARVHKKLFTVNGTNPRYHTVADARDDATNFLSLFEAARDVVATDAHYQSAINTAVWQDVIGRNIYQPLVVGFSGYAFRQAVQSAEAVEKAMKGLHNHPEDKKMMAVVREGITAATVFDSATQVGAAVWGAAYFHNFAQMSEVRNPQESKLDAWKELFLNPSCQRLIGYSVSMGVLVPIAADALQTVDVQHLPSQMSQGVAGLVTTVKGFLPSNAATAAEGAIELARGQAHDQADAFRTMMVDDKSYFRTGVRDYLGEHLGEFGEKGYDAFMSKVQTAQNGGALVMRLGYGLHFNLPITSILTANAIAYHCAQNLLQEEFAQEIGLKK